MDDILGISGNSFDTGNTGSDTTGSSSDWNSILNATGSLSTDATGLLGALNGTTAKPATTAATPVTSSTTTTIIFVVLAIVAGIFVFFRRR